MTKPSDPGNRDRDMIRAITINSILTSRLMTYLTWMTLFISVIAAVLAAGQLRLSQMQIEIQKQTDRDAVETQAYID